MSNLDVSRELITLSRQGGHTLRDIRDAKLAAAAVPKEKAANTKDRGSKADDGKTMGGRAQSAPTLTATVRSSMGGNRRGGGWAHDPGGDDLAKFKEKLDEAVARGVDLDFAERPFFRTAVWEATWKNNEAVVRVLASRGANLWAADFQGRTPLHEAAFYGHSSLLEFLLDHGHPIDPVDDLGQTPLFRAVDGGRHEIVKLLIARGANTNRVDANNVTVQHVAAFNGMPTLASYLVNHGAVKNRLSLDGVRATPMGKSAMGPTISITKKDTWNKPLKTSAALMFSEMRRHSRSSTNLGIA